MPTGTRPAAKEDKGRQYHCARMVEFRRKKKQEREELHKELRRLQRAMKQQEEFVRNEAASSRQFRDSSTMVLLREVIVEKEALLTQNIALRKEIDRHEPIQTLVQEEPQCYSEYQSRSDKLMLSPSVDQVGWQVHVPNGEQSFYVHPFSRKEFDAFPNPFDAGYTAGSSSYSYAGTYLGWKVYRVPTRENPLSIHVRFTKRIQCSVDTAFKTWWDKEADLFPILVTPIGWEYRQRHRVTTQVLQEFDRDSHLMFHNIPGQTHFRYMFLGRRAQWKLLDGRRKMGYSMLMVEPKVTKRAEEHRDNVKWFTEGGNYLTLTEVDDTATDAMCEQWVNCESELHAEYLILQWIHLAVRWEQQAIPSNLLTLNP